MPSVQVGDAAPRVPARSSQTAKKFWTHRTGTWGRREGAGLAMRRQLQRSRRAPCRPGSATAGSAAPHPEAASGSGCLQQPPSRLPLCPREPAVGDCVTLASAVLKKKIQEKLCKIWIWSKTHGWVRKKPSHAFVRGLPRGSCAERHPLVVHQPPFPPRCTAAVTEVKWYVSLSDHTGRQWLFSD